MTKASRDTVGSPDNSVIDPKVYASKIRSTYKTLRHLAVPAAETKSVGLPANALVSWFLLFHLDSFIVTRKLSSIYRDLCKNKSNRDADGNKPYRRALACTDLELKTRQLQSLNVKSHLDKFLIA